MAKDTRYLEFHGQKWRVTVAVPTALQQLFGKKHLKHPLATDSLELANELKGEHVTKFKRMIREARSGKAPRQSQDDPLIVEALQLKFDREQEQDALDFGELEHLGRHRPIFPDAIANQAEEIEVAEGWRRASQFKAVAMGEATPLLSVVDAYLAEQPFKERQKRDYRRAVEKFNALACCRFRGHPVWVFHEAGGGKWEDEDLGVSSRSRRFA